MSTAALQQDALLPQPVGGTAPGAALALVVHAGLIAALAFGVDWRAHAPDVVSAELWAAVPQTAAPPPPPAPEPTPAPAPAPQPAPAPPPPTKAEAPAPDITIERERQKAEAAKRKLEAEQKAEADRKKREQLEADRKEKADKLAKAKAEQAAKAAEERLAQQREENLRRMLAQAGSAGGTATAGTATTTAAPSAAYAGLVRNAIRSQLSYPGDLSQITRAAEIEVNAAPGGSIISRKLIKSSGTRDFDEAVLRAIDKAGSLPRNPNGPVPATLIISFRPND
jgi:colicin import membrane protein